MSGTTSTDPVKMYGFPVRGPGVSATEFHDHWRHPHAALASGIPGIYRYTQSHRIDSPLLDERQERVDGIAENWFATAADAVGLPTDPVYVATVAPDEPNFVDTKTLLFAFVRDEVLVADRTADGPDRAAQLWSAERGVATKLFVVVEPGGEQDWAQENDAELGRRIGALRHVRAHPAPEAYETSEPLVIGVHELWWPTVSDFERGVAADPEAFAELVGRGAHGFAVLCRAELVFDRPASTG
jgi:hypothetical protein